MPSVDEVLTVIKNPVRRKILQLLTLEDHYQSQLADQTKIKQPACIKHLQVLVDAGMVKKRKGPSTSGGPPRTYYSLNYSFSLQIDLTSTELLIDLKEMGAVKKH